MQASPPMSTNSQKPTSVIEHLVSETAAKAHPGGEDRSRYCGQCGHQNSAEVNVCLNCAAPLEQSCPHCKQPVQAGRNFCGRCGVRLTEQHQPTATTGRAAKARTNQRSHLPTALAEKIRSASVKAQGERREVTILFLDVTNFTATSCALDSEDVYDVINRAMSTLVEVVRRYGGTIDKFTGDGLMALFGAPVTHENDPERAIRAALEMQTALYPLQEHVKQIYGYDFQVRIGINTGWVIAGKVGNSFHTEYTVIGDSVNLAARLESAADPGTILVSQETYQRTRSIFSFTTVPPLTLKGIFEPVQAYRPLALLNPTRVGSGFWESQTAMVGREPELAHLQQSWQAVQEHHHRRIVLISGEAGVGKSKLVAEFCQTLVGTNDKVYRGNCSAYSQASPLSVVATLLRNILDLSEAESSDHQQEILETYLGQHHLLTDDIQPYLSHVLGLEQKEPQLKARLSLLDAAMLQQQTHVALRRVFLAEARLAPTIFVLEDLHWIDTASRNFLEYLIQTDDELPLLLIFVSRQLESEAILQPLLFAAQKVPERYVELPLRPLTAAEGQSLVGQFIKQTTPEALPLKRRIVKRAEGNPFFIEEIIRMLIDQGGLVRVQAVGAWQVTPPANKLLNKIPGTVQGLILARFDRLPERVRQTLQKAAVIGPSFPLSLLQRLNGINAKTLGAHLDELEGRRFLNSKPFSTKPGYTFRHALVQETVYSTLLKRDRCALHTKVAEAIEAGQSWLPDEKIEALAYHYAEGIEPMRAIPYLMMAADSAARRCAYDTTIEHYRRIIQLTGDQPDAASREFFEVRIGLGRALKYVGELADARQILSEVLQILKDLDVVESHGSLHPASIEALRQLADVRQREGLYDEALSHLETGLQLLTEAGSQEQLELRHALLDRMAWIRFRQGQLDQASALARAAIGDASPEDTADPLTLASLYNTLGGICWQQGQLDEAIGFVRRSLRLYEGVGYFWGRAVAYGNLGVLYDGLGNWPKATAYYEQAYALQENIGDRQSQTINLINLGVVRMRMGQHALARQALETGLTLSQSVGLPWSTALCRASLAELNIVQSKFHEARTHVDEALTISQAIGSSEIQIQARRFLAHLQAADDQLPASLETAAQALKLAQESQLLAEEANCFRLLGYLLAVSGQYLEAETHFQHSIALALAQNDPYRQALAQFELGRMYQERAESEAPVQADWRSKAFTQLSEAAEKFEGLGADHDLSLARAAKNQIQTNLESENNFANGK